MLNPDEIQRFVELLHDADCVLVGAGAGLSVDAGIDYTDTVSFARRFPALAKHGFRMKAELIGYTGWTPEVQWGYLSLHVNEVRFQPPPHLVYRRLREMVTGKDYFVMTSNVDGMFFKSGFAANKVFTPQGDYARMQCLTPCRNATWPTKPIIDRILPTVDPETQEVTDPNVIPRCPHCGGEVFMNVRGGRWFIEDPYLPQSEALAGWLDGTRDSRLLAIEFGAGFNTPSVIRWPMEVIVHEHPRARLVRVNLQWPQVPEVIASQALSLQCRAMDAITAVWEAMG
ncbi:MAG: NAD-dependent protein deacetylase of SIR2 family, partial [Pseudomonadota bacterium]